MCKIVPSHSSSDLLTAIDEDAATTASTSTTSHRDQGTTNVTEKEKTYANKKVRFASKNSNQTIVISSSASDNNDKEIWWDSKMIQRNKQLCAQQGKAWQDKGYGKLLLKNVLSNPTNNRDNLDLFVQLPGNDYVRGMENYLCDNLRRERRAQRNRLVQAVIDREIELKSQQWMHSSPEQIAQELAVISLNHSNTARDFAKRLGMADELAYRLGENPELPRLLLTVGNRNTIMSHYCVAMLPKKELGSLMMMMERAGLWWFFCSIAILAVVIGGHH